MMYTNIGNALSYAAAAGKKIVNVIRKGNRKYFSTIDNMFLQDDIFEHETFR